MSEILAILSGIHYIGAYRHDQQSGGRTPMGRRAEVNRLQNRVRELRQAAGLSQAELAERAGITRQGVSAIESGQYLPNTVVALRLSAALGCAVEDLFSLGDISRKLRARMGGRNQDWPVGDRRVRLARVGDVVIAEALIGESGLAAADGIAPSTEQSPGEVAVDLLVDPEVIERTVVVLGCDPSLGLLAEHVQRQTRDYRVHWRHAGSLAALQALRDGEAHIAGTHLWDPETGESNLPAIKRELAGRSVAVIALSQWQQGLLVSAGNPRGIRGVLDLARSEVSLVNREPGSGSRSLLDHHLETAGLRPEWITGYDRLRRSHADIAAAVRDGLADAGPGILAAARLYGLDFIPLQEERYDLVVPSEFLSYGPVRSVLETASGDRYRREVETLGGYDPSPAGTVIAEIGP
jgi:putative molybdopterin biosynthesis protein